MTVVPKRRHYTAGSWTNAGDYKQSGDFDAKMVVQWTGDEGLLTMGTGPDHGIFDIYIGGSLWQSYDGYSADPGERVIQVPPGTLEIRSRPARNIRSTGYVIRFKQFDAVEVTYDERSIQYIYDTLSRLTEADHGHTQYTYGFDLAGNLTDLNGVSRTYDAANRLVHDGTTSLTYDANGNLTNDGTNSYVWDHANRLLAHGGISYKYNGDGIRVQQDALKYILDVQPELALVIGDSDGNRFVHGPRGLHSVYDGGDWAYPVTDGLGSVRGYTDAVGGVLSSVNYSEYGVPSAAWDGPAFTGEWRDANALQHHRARYYAPGLAVWTALDPWEGLYERPMSLNGYSWVEGNVVNKTDPSGKMAGLAAVLNSGLCIGQPQGQRQGMGGCEQACRTHLLTVFSDIMCRMICEACENNPRIMSTCTMFPHTQIVAPTPTHIPFATNTPWPTPTMPPLQPGQEILPGLPTATPGLLRLPVDSARLSNCDFTSRTVLGLPSRDVNPLGSSEPAYVYSPASAEVMIVDTTGNNAGLGQFVALRINSNLLPNNQWGNGYLYIGYAHLSAVYVQPGLNAPYPAVSSNTPIGMTGASGTDNVHLDITTFFVPYPLTGGVEPVPRTTGLTEGTARAHEYFQSFFSLGLSEIYQAQIVDPLLIWPELAEGTNC